MTANVTTDLPTPALVLSLASLALFSLADLRCRTAPGVEVFFLSAVSLAALTGPLTAALVVLAVVWGLVRRSPPMLALPLLLHPSTWAVVLIGAGVRRRLIGGADLLALGGLACLFDWQVPVLALVGVELWRRGWGKWGAGPMPAMPGMFLGLTVYVLWELALDRLAA